MIYKVYARTITISNLKLVEEVFSSKFDEPTSNDVLVDEGEGQEYIHVQSRYILFDENLLHNYKIVNGKIAKTTTADKRKEMTARPKPPKTQMQLVQEEITSQSSQLCEISEQTLNNTNELLITQEKLQGSDQLNNEMSEYVLSLEQRIAEMESRLEAFEKGEN